MSAMSGTSSARQFCRLGCASPGQLSVHLPGSVSDRATCVATASALCIGCSGHLFILCMLHLMRCDPPWMSSDPVAGSGAVCTHRDAAISCLANSVFGRRSARPCPYTLVCKRVPLDTTCLDCYSGPPPSRYHPACLVKQPHTCWGVAGAYLSAQGSQGTTLQSKRPGDQVPATL
jgi:hypothetical protein